MSPFLLRVWTFLHFISAFLHHLASSSVRMYFGRFAAECQAARMRIGTSKSEPIVLYQKRLWRSSSVLSSHSHLKEKMEHWIDALSENFSHSGRVRSLVEN